MTSMKYIAYPRTTEDMLANVGRTPSNYKFYGICQSACPAALEPVCNYELATGAYAGITTTDIRACLDNVHAASSGGFACEHVRDNCWTTPQHTKSIMFRCVPMYNVTNTESSTCIYPHDVTDPNSADCVVVREKSDGSVERPAQQNLLFDSLNSAANVWSRYFGDLARTWWVILVSAIVVGAIAAFAFLMLLKYCTALMVWLTIFITLVVCVALTALLYYKAGVISADSVSSIADIKAAITGGSSEQVSQNLDDSSSTTTTMYRWAAYLMTALTVIGLILIVAMRRTIRVAIDVMKMGSSSMLALPGLLGVPVVGLALLVPLVVWWLYVAAALMSAGDKVDVSVDVSAAMQSFGQTGGNYTMVGYDDLNIMKYLQAYNFFGLLWTANFIMGLGMVTIAGAVSGWYFSRNPNNSSEITVHEAKRGFVVDSFLRALRYQLGSIAFGSLLIALLQMIRAVMVYIDQKTKDIQEKNRIVALAMRCVHCLLAIFQKVVEVVTRQAYILVAMKGLSFTEAGGTVFYVIANNLKVLAVVNGLSEVFMLLGKLTVASICAMVAFMIIDNSSQFQAGGENEVTAAWLPAFMTWLMAFVVAAVFFDVLDLCVDSTIMCYIIDADENMYRHDNKTEFRVPAHVQSNAIAQLADKHSSRTLTRRGKRSSDGSAASAKQNPISESITQ